MVAGGESEKQYLDNTHNILNNGGIDNGEDEDDDGEDDPISDQKVRTLLMRRGTVTTLITRQPFDRPAVSTH